MLGKERIEPIGYTAEERKPLHLRKAAEIDVRALLLHVDHLAETCLHGFHGMLGGSRIKDILHGVFLLLGYSEARNVEVVALK